jgi:hypothetical protein
MQVYQKTPHLVTLPVISLREGVRLYTELRVELAFCTIAVAAREAMRVTAAARNKAEPDQRRALCKNEDPEASGGLAQTLTPRLRLFGR